MKHLLRTLLFFAIGAVLLLLVQTVFIPQYLGGNTGKPKDMLGEYYELRSETDLQVVFVGSSHAYCGVDPMRIYEDTGIVSYNLSSAAQSIPESFYLLKMLFKTQKPELVFLDASSLFTDEAEEDYNFQIRYRYLLDNMGLSRDRLELARHYTSLLPEGSRLEGFIGAYVPLLYYHSRWDELTREDFMPDRAKNYYSKGYVMMPSTVGASWDSVGMMNYVADLLSTREDRRWSFTDGDVSTKPKDDEPAYSAAFDEGAMSSLREIMALCEENGAELILFKIPDALPPQYYSSAWTEIRSEMTRETAAELGLEFLDLLYDVDLEIDWSADTIDQGMHLNYLGAQKVSRYLADYLANEKQLSGRTDPVYERDRAVYDKLCALAELQTEPTMSGYLERIAAMEDVTVLFAVYDDMHEGLTEEDIRCLRDFGLQCPFESMESYDSYLAVVEDGELRYEDTSTRRIEYEGTLSNGTEIHMVSSGGLMLPEVSIQIDGREYTQAVKGLIILVYDNRSGLVLDGVAVNMSSGEERTNLRDSGDVGTFFEAYEQYLMREDYLTGTD